MFGEHWPFFAILGAGALLTLVMVGVRLLAWRARWDVSRFGGILVRFEDGVAFTPALGRDLALSLEEVEKAIALRFPDRPDLLDFRVEVCRPGDVQTPTVPAGRLPNGEIVGGSIRTERAFPLTKLHYVAVVVDERTGSFVAHEVARHIVPARLLGDVDHAHRLERFAAFEKELKERIRARKEAEG